MPIVQRCPKCQWLFPLEKDTCPNPECASPVGRGLRNLYFRTKVKGKRHLKNAGHIPLQEARVRYAEWITELSAPTTPPSDPIVGFRQVINAYLNKLKAEGKSYHIRAKLYLTRMLDFGLDRPCSEIRSDMIRRFQTYLRESGCAPAYCDRHLEMGRAAWNYSLKGKVANPFDDVKYYRPDNTLIRELTPKEEANLLLAAKNLGRKGPPLFYEMLAVAIYTGMRASNVFRLRAEEVDFDNNCINVIQKRSLRLQVYMNGVVREVLHRITPSNAGWYFPNPKTGEPYGQVRKSFATVKKAAGINRLFRFHDLRHHFAKRIAEQTNGNLLLIKGALGHRDIHTSMKYLPPFQNEIRAAVEGIVEDRSQKGSSEGSS